MKKLWNQYSYVIILIAISYLSIFILFNSFNKQDDFINIIVQEGESLWEIAERYSEHHSMTSQQFVHWVEKKNSIVGEKIIPGEQLLVPVNTMVDLDIDTITLAGQ